MFEQGCAQKHLRSKKSLDCAYNTVHMEGGTELL